MWGGEEGDGGGENVGEVAFDDVFEVVPGLTETVIGEAVLGEVVGFDLLGAGTGTDSLRALGGEGGEATVFLCLPKLGTEEIESDFFVSGLIALFTDKCDDAGRDVGEANGSIDLVDVLTTWATGTGELPFKIFVADFELVSFDFGKNGNGSGAGMDAPLRFGFWDSLDAVDARFVLKCFISAVVPKRAVWTA